MMASEQLPSFLLIDEPLEPEQLPLQVHLLTLEMASIRVALAAVARLLMMPEADCLLGPGTTSQADERSGLDPERD